MWQLKLKINKGKKLNVFLPEVLESYKVLKNENPELRIGKVKFYSFRPKYVVLSPIKEVCLCVYCAKFNLFLTSLLILRGSKASELHEIRSQIMNAITCSEPFDLCFLQEYKICPPVRALRLTF